MLHLTDDMIERLVSASEAESVLRSAFIDFAGGRAAMQARARTEAGGVKLSTLGAVIPGQGVTGAKVYTTINGQFRFVILLFSTEDGRPLACLDAGTITRIRTAACSLLAARELAPERPQRMALFGAGVQGSAHAEQFSRAFGLGRIAVCDPYAKPETIALLQSRCEAEVDVAS
ncbi:MAG TPA: ornithine cyclodeaminase family protein, partial [Noviherbaspirillum sp.]|nr:ornithine cyclodeaminase family protein [Noviherbaspirillum sp.]